MQSQTMPAWRYETSTGQSVRGYVERTSDRGGSDVTYIFRRESGETDVVSGARLRQAARLWGEVLPLQS